MAKKIAAKKIITTVTVTGADDSIRPEQLIPLAERFRFVEFGILLSKKQQGNKRFPSRNWLEKLYVLSLKNSINLSGHICGSWVRNLCMGEPAIFHDLGYLCAMFRRFQLNFHGEPHVVDAEKFGNLLEGKFCNKQVIFQMDGTGNEKTFSFIKDMFNVDAVPLLDSSSGRGELPKEWPLQLGRPCGYAGGLSPDNVQAEIKKISKVATGPIWIDAETLLRSENDKIFSLSKVRRFLEASESWVFKP